MTSGVRCAAGGAAIAVVDFAGDGREGVVAAEAEQAQLRETDAGLRAELPLTWLRDVWAKEIATVWSRFCLQATADDGSLTLTTIGPDLGAVEVVTISCA